MHLNVTASRLLFLIQC